MLFSNFPTSFIPFRRFFLLGLIVGLMAAPFGLSQTSPKGKSPKPDPAVISSADAQEYDIRVEILPESHRLKAQVTIVFVATGILKELVLDLNPNCSMTQVLDAEGREVEHRQDSYETNSVKVVFREAVQDGTRFSLQFVYEGIFEKGRRRPMNTVQEVDAVIAEEGCYLPFAAKWLPINRFPIDRASSRITVSVPLGYEALGAGKQLPSKTEGIQEVFSSVCRQPHLPDSLVVAPLFPRSVDKNGLKVEYHLSETNLSAADTLDNLVRPLVAYFESALGPRPWEGPLLVVEVPNEYDYFPGSPSVIYVGSSLVKAVKPDLSVLTRKVASQWWHHALPVFTPEQCWLREAFSYYSEVLRLEKNKEMDKAKEALEELRVIALEGEGKSALANAWRLGYMTDHYLNLAGGKGAWILHMLRKMLGDEPFEKMVSQWRTNFRQPQPRTLSFQDLAAAAYKEKLDWFFTEWVDSIGVPQFELEFLVYKTRSGFRISGSVKQDKDLFRMPLEVGVQTDSKMERAPVVVTGKRSDFRLNTEAKPTNLVVDPESNVLHDSPELKVAVFLSKGRKLAQRQEFVEAVQQFEEALALDPRRSMANYYLGEVFYEQWNLQSAANAFREALNGDLNPKWVETWCFIYLGKIFDILGQRDRAVAEYTKAVNTKDDTNGAQAEAKKYLKQPFTRPRTVMGAATP
jgi:hypothetical protein